MRKTRTKKNGKNNYLGKSKRRGRGIGASKVSARPYGRLLRMEAVKDDLDGWVNVKAVVGNLVETPSYSDEMKEAPARSLEEQEQNEADRVVARAIAVHGRDAAATVDTMSDDEQTAFLAMSAAEQREFLGISDNSSPMSAARAAVAKETARNKAANQSTFSLGRYVVIGG